MEAVQVHARQSGTLGSSTWLTRSRSPSRLRPVGAADVELERLLRLGARPADIGQTGEEPWHVLADPEGNEFCLLKARLDPL
jgi:hypothetical protein